MTLFCPLPAASLDLQETYEVTEGAGETGPLEARTEPDPRPGGRGSRAGPARLLEVAGDIDDDVGAGTPAAADDEGDLALGGPAPEADYPAGREGRPGPVQLIVEAVTVVLVPGRTAT